MQRRAHEEYIIYNKKQVIIFNIHITRLSLMMIVRRLITKSKHTQVACTYYNMVSLYF